jgi:hypothetical protein
MPPLGMEEGIQMQLMWQLNVLSFLEQLNWINWAIQLLQGKNPAL